MLNFNPRCIEQVENQKIRIEWEDGHKTELEFSALRRQCPCAMCKDEWTGEVLVDPGAIPDTIAASKADVVGNYALSFRFSDGHTAGIYSFEFLRRLCKCGECSYHAGSETN